MSPRSVCAGALRSRSSAKARSTRRAQTIRPFPSLQWKRAQRSLWKAVRSLSERQRNRACSRAMAGRSPSTAVRSSMRATKSMPMVAVRRLRSTSPIVRQSPISSSMGANSSDAALRSVTTTSAGRSWRKATALCKRRRATGRCTKSSPWQKTPTRSLRRRVQTRSLPCSTTARRTSCSRRM